MYGDSAAVTLPFRRLGWEDQEWETDLSFTERVCLKPTKKKKNLENEDGARSRLGLPGEKTQEELQQRERVLRECDLPRPDCPDGFVAS